MSTKTNSEGELARHYGLNTTPVRHLEFYRDYYALPTVCHEDVVTRELFHYCKHRRYFVNILAAQAHRVFMRRGFGDRLEWELPGSAVRTRGHETPIDAAFRIIARDIPGIDIGELQPIVYVTKVYKYQSESVTHEGVTFLGRVRRPDISTIEANDDIKGRFIDYLEPEEVERLRSTDARILNLAMPQLEYVEQQRNAELQIDAEVSSGRAIGAARMFVHNHLVKPAFRSNASELLRRAVLERLRGVTSYLDVACGDDKLVYDVASQVALCVANDANWDTVTELQKRQSTRNIQRNLVGNIIFVNHDACRMPFKRKFDLVVCKNMVHHMTSEDRLQDLLRSIRQVAHRALIIDPEDPNCGTTSARIWNWYYRSVLNDCGEHFFRADELLSALRQILGESTVPKVSTIETPKGKFLLFELDFATTGQTT